MGGSSPNSDFNFFGEILCFFVFLFHVRVLYSCFKMFQKKKMGNGMGGWGPTNPSFSRIFELF